MSIDFIFFMTLLLTTPNAVVLLVCIGVGGCLCPMNSRMCRDGTASRKFMYSAPTSASAVNDSTLWKPKWGSFALKMGTAVHLNVLQSIWFYCSAFKFAVAYLILF